MDFEESVIVLEDDEDEVFNEDIHSLIFPTHIVECFADAEGLLNMMSINKPLKMFGHFNVRMFPLFRRFILSEI